jgi:predicted TIM-barrel fold metal-dependent hydrolase
MIDRRDVLAGVAAALVVPHLGRGQQVAGGQPAGPPAARVAMDWHSHFVTRAEVEFLRRRRRAPRVYDNAEGHSVMETRDTVSAAAGQPSEFSPSDVTTRLQQLDRHGVARQLLTHTVAMGLDALLTVAELRTLFRAVNDELAEVVRAHPTRFSAVAAVPTADPAWAAGELERAHRELGLIGVSLPLNAFATLASARTLAPLFAAAQRHGSHIFVHRGPANGHLPGQPALVLPSDTGYARWSLISNAHLAAGGITLTLTDFLDPYPDVTVEVVMLAGFLPYLSDTLIPAARQAGVQDPLARLRRIYYDTGPYARQGAWVADAARKLGADRLLFGTDFGVGGGTRGDLGPALASLDGALSPEQRQALYVDNSRELLRRHGIA